MKTIKPVQALPVPRPRNKTAKTTVRSATRDAERNMPRRNAIGGTVQKGKIYLKDSSWWFRFKTPIIRDGKKVWKDRYERLAPANAFDSIAQVKKSRLLAQYRDDLDTSQMTPSMMQTVNAFVENTYFPCKKETLKPSTLS